MLPTSSRRAAILVRKLRRNTWRGRFEKKPGHAAGSAHRTETLFNAMQRVAAKVKRQSGLPLAWRSVANIHLPGDIPVLLVYPMGQEPFAILPADAFARLAGISTTAARRTARARSGIQMTGAADLERR